MISHNLIELQKNRIRNAGFKLTHARVTVLKALQVLDGHCTSTQIVAQVMKLDESVGRASVFRALDLLTQLNIIRPTYIESSMTPRYVLLPEGHHHHVICTNCSRVIEFDDCELTELTQQLETRYNLKISGHLLEFYALCENCQTA